MGKAYAFFNCNASKNEIEAELPTIRKLTQTPNQLEISLTENVNELKGDQNLLKFIGQNKVYPIFPSKLKALIVNAQTIKMIDLRYVLKAKYPKATNKATADELGMILNQAYQSPLYQDEEPFIGKIVYKEKKSIFLENKLFEFLNI